LLGTDGYLYGTAFEGGPLLGGTIFKITPSGVLTTIYAFESFAATGEAPQGGLIYGPDGNLYGTTTHGGSGGIGTFFKITPGGAYTQLFSFPYTRGSSLQGAYPMGLVLGPDGNFYGVTEYGGLHGEGVIFRISPSGNFAVLQSMGIRN